jgi:hypothetical protein
LLLWFWWWWCDVLMITNWCCTFEFDSGYECDSDYVLMILHLWFWLWLRFWLCSWFR